MSLTKVTYSMISGAFTNVFDFGAAGDSVTDDTSAIQAAIDATYANGGGVVFFPTGIFLVSSQITVPETVSIQGSGYQLSDSDFYTPKGTAIFLKANSGLTTTQAVVRFKNLSTVSYPMHYGFIKDIMIHGNNANTNSSCGLIFDSSRSTQAVNVGVFRCGYNGISFSGTCNGIVIDRCNVGWCGANGIYMQGGENILVNTGITTCNDAGIFSVSGKTIIAHNNSADNKKQGMYLQDCVGVKVVGNVTQDNQWNGIHIASSGARTDDITIVGNQIADNGNVGSSGTDLQRSGILWSVASTQSSVVANFIGNSRTAPSTGYPNAPAQKYGIYVTNNSTRLAYSNNTGTNLSAAIYAPSYDVFVGATGTFTSADGKTVTVSQGTITSIV